MTISLPPELELMVQAKVDSGQYPSPSEVVRVALQLMEDRDQLDALRRFVAVGIEQADRGQLIESTLVFEEIRERIRQKTGQSS